MTLIIAIGGKKSSGKTSLSYYLSAAVNDIALNDSKRIYNLYQLENNPRDVKFDNGSFLEEYDFKDAVNSGIIKTYSFADALKTFLSSSFEVTEDQMYGSDEEKNIKTKYMWDTLPSFTRWVNSPLKNLSSKRGSGGIIFAKKDFINSINTEEDFLQALCWGWIPGEMRMGHMTARELMQVLGTDIGRKMFDNNIWVNATFNNIKKDNPKIAIIDDLRFCSEADAVLRERGVVVLLSRNSDSTDIHGSEKDLENFNIESDRVICIDNEDNINKKNKECLFSLIDIFKREISSDFSKQI